MIQTTKVSEDPLKDIQKKKLLPLFATKCGINHFSPSQFAKPDASWLIEYVHFDQPTRRKILKPNAAMASGIAVGNVLQNVLADEIWKLNSARKLAPVKWTKLKKEESLQEEIEKYKDYEPTDDKDRTKHQKYLEEIPQLVSNGFKALEEIGLASPIICEKQISLTSDNAPTFCSPCSLACVGRTDFEFGSTVFGGKSPHETSPTTSVAFPQKLIELKTKYSRLGKIKKDGSRSFVKAAIPTTPSFNHLVQCAFYSSYYNFKVPMYLLYVVEAGYKIYNSNNCPGLTVEGLKKNYQIMMNVFKRREKILALNEDKSKEEIIAGAIEIMDPMFDHPYAWNNYPTDVLQEIKSMWGVV
tara:strand:+ start:2178 stop:3245 length:1068 start_codon:yes stop_codon:yes gene_type:complete